jgi:hypothetical protein
MPHYSKRPELRQMMHKWAQTQHSCHQPQGSASIAPHRTYFFGPPSHFGLGIELRARKYSWLAIIRGIATQTVLQKPAVTSHPWPEFVTFDTEKALSAAYRLGKRWLPCGW